MCRIVFNWMYGNVMEHYPAVPGFKEPTTSKEAAEKAASHSPVLKARILELLGGGPFFGSVALTADEIAARLDESPLSIRPRITELAVTGKIKRTGMRRPNASGCWAHVYRRVEA